MNTRLQQAWRVPLTLLLLNLFCFGLLIPWLGFYWDDWPSIWFLHFLGPQGFAQVFASDRPLLGWLFQLTTSLLGESIIAWQVFGFLTRWLSSIAFWWALRALWPQHERLAAFAAVLFAVYPGFGQQFISVTYSHVFILLALALFSLGAMLRVISKRSIAINDPRHRERSALSNLLRRDPGSPTDNEPNPRFHWGWFAVSWLSAAFSLFSVEYFFGLELLRPLVLWLATGGEKFASRVRRTLLLWLPYLALLVGFLAWRVVIQDTPRGQVQLLDKLQANPAPTMLDLVQNVVSDVIQSSLLAWTQTLDFTRLQGFGALASAGYAGLSLLAIGIAIFGFYRLQRTFEHPAQAPPAQRIALQAIALGILALLAGGWPFWSTNLPIELRFPWDRFTLAMMPGASLLFAGLLELVGRAPRLRAAILGILVGLALGQHYLNANLYRREWNQQKAFYWQLSWRAPAIQPGTLLLASELPFVHFSDNSLTAALNWMYASQSFDDPMPYLFFAIESRLGGGLASLESGIPVDEPYRATSFQGSTSQAIVLYYTPPGCLKVLDPAIDARLPQKPKYIAEAMPLSRLELITPSAAPASPPVSIFGSQPAPDWCYYFEKAELARQQGDWATVAELSEQALSLDQRLYEVNAPELLPYIEARAHIGDWSGAAALSRRALQLTTRIERSLCDTWQRVLASTPPDEQRQRIAEDLAHDLACLR